jgi:hypothetical protein
MSLEKVIRPFQLGDIGPPKPVATGSSAQADTNLLKFGEGGSARLLFGSVTIDESFYAVKKMREKAKPTT